MHEHLDGPKVTGRVERVGVCLFNIAYMSGGVHIRFNLSVINYSLAFFSCKKKIPEFRTALDEKLIVLISLPISN